MNHFTVHTGGTKEWYMNHFTGTHQRDKGVVHEPFYCTHQREEGVVYALTFFAMNSLSTVYLKTKQKTPAHCLVSHKDKSQFVV